MLASCRLVKTPWFRSGERREIYFPLQQIRNVEIEIGIFQSYLKRLDRHLLFKLMELFKADYVALCLGSFFTRSHR